MYSAFIFSNLRLKMIQIGDVVVSFDVLREKFLCDLNACKGACCVEGDAGAPVELDEIEKLVRSYPTQYHLVKYAKMLAYNGHEAEARHQLQRLKAIHKKELSWSELIKKQPQ